MERFVSSIEASVEAGNWYAALGMALTTPDICGWLESPSSGSRARYEAWFDRYLLPFYRSSFHGPDFTFLSGSDCYALRCSFLHEGSDQVLRQRARLVLERFAFSTTGSHRCLFGNVLLLNVQTFCSEVCQATRSWTADTAGNADVQERMRELVHVHTSGFSIAPGISVQ